MPPSQTNPVMRFSGIKSAMLTPNPAHLPDRYHLPCNKPHGCATQAGSPILLNIGNT
ncbi:hypothetical protein GGS24DRAFT_481478 [Hypoxylon argillaceum]|nr:hypothetical protein GGS24DRAFT_481478 [Hypoxylon argillaceum]